MNELFFFLHILFVFLGLLVSLRIGKEALVSIICLQVVLANLFVVKQMDLFGLSVTCADVYIVGAMLGLNLLQEYFGEKIVKKTVWINGLCSIFYLVMTRFQLFYIPNSFDTTDGLFAGILQFIPRIVIASLFTIFVAQLLEISLYRFLKKFFKSKYLISRNIIALIFVQFVDTLMFSFLGLYGIVGNIFDVIVMSFFIKVIVIFSLSPFLGFVKKVVRIREE